MAKLSDYRVSATTDLQSCIGTAFHQGLPLRRISYTQITFSGEGRSCTPVDLQQFTKLFLTGTSERSIRNLHDQPLYPAALTYCQLTLPHKSLTFQSQTGFPKEYRTYSKQLGVKLTLTYCSRDQPFTNNSLSPSG